MHNLYSKKRIRGGVSLLTGFVLLLTNTFIYSPTLSLHGNEAHHTPQTSKVPTPALKQATEVSWTNSSTASVKNAAEFISAYVNENITRIKLLQQVDITKVQRDVAYHQLSRPLQIDGQGHMLKTTTKVVSPTQATFNLSRLQPGKRATLHLKNVNIGTRGGRYIDAETNIHQRSIGWQLILDDVRFNPQQVIGSAVQFDRASQIASLPAGHIFLRNTVHIETTNENLIAGQITVEPNANITNKVTGNASNWSFTQPNKDILTVDNTVNIGPGAVVELSSSNGPNYPAIQLHWRTINVHQGAGLHVSRPGNAYTFTYTDGMPQKAIHVLTGATFIATNTSNVGAPIINEVIAPAHLPLTSTFYAAPGSTIKLNGRSNNISTALVHLRNKQSSFELDTPASYDIRNNLNRIGTKAVIVGRDGQLSIKDTHIGVWDSTRRAANFSASPDASWYRATLIANGLGKALPGTGAPNNTTSSLRDTWNTTKYARISNDIPGPPTIPAKSSVIYQKNAIITEKQFLQDIIGAPTNLTKIASNFKTAVKLDTIGAYAVTITAEDTAGNKVPEAKVTVIIKDSQTIIDADNDTMIRAQNFAVNLHELSTADFVGRAHAQAWRLSTGEQIDVQLYSPLPETEGKHIFAFIAEKTIKSVELTITNFLVPTLSSDERVYYSKGTTVTDKTFHQNANATLDGEGTITSDFASVVDLNTVGAYIVTIQGENAHGHKTNTVQTIVFIYDQDTKLDFNTDTMIYAHDFTLDIAQLPDADFLTLAEAKAWDLETGQNVDVHFNAQRPTGFGTHRITFIARDTILTVKAIVNTASELFLNADTRIIYEEVPSRTATEFLGDINASMRTPGTITTDFEAVVDFTTLGAYVVTTYAVDAGGNKSNTIQTIVLISDKFTVIDEANDTMLAAQNFGIRLSDLPTEEEDFIALAQAKAWNIVTAELLPVRLVTPKPTTAGMHGIVFGAGPTMKLIIGAIVDDVYPTVHARDGVLYEKGVTKTEEEFLTDIGASLNKPGVIRSDFETAVDLTTVGVYPVILQGEDFLGGRGPTLKVTVLVADENTSFDFENDIMVSAHDITLPLADVPTADFVALAEAKAWLISTGETITITDETMKPTETGTFRTRFHILDDFSFSVKIHVIADDTSEPEIPEQETNEVQEDTTIQINNRLIKTSRDTTWVVVSERLPIRLLTKI